MDPIIGLILLLLGGATVVYGIAKVLGSINWEKLKDLIRDVAKSISSAVQKAAHLFVSVFVKKIAVGFLDALFGAKGLAYYMFASIWNKAQRIIYNEKKKEFNSLSEIRDGSIRESVEQFGSWALETALES